LVAPESYETTSAAPGPCLPRAVLQAKVAGDVWGAQSDKMSLYVDALDGPSQLEFGFQEYRKTTATATVAASGKGLLDGKLCSAWWLPPKWPEVAVGRPTDGSLQGMADVDTDGDGTLDAASVALAFTATPVEIEGLALP